jgi:hypothetical protein
MPPRDPNALEEDRFKWFPTEQNIVPGDAALMLRYHFWMLMIAHGFFFIMMELIIYEFRFFLVLMEFVYAFVAYHCVMTLEPKWIYGYMVLMGTSVFSLGYITEVGNFLCGILFVIQIVFYLFIGGFLTCRRLGAMKDELENGQQN